MPATALALALGAAFIHASWNLLVARSRDPGVATAVAAALSVTLPLPLVAATWRAASPVVPLAIASSGFELAYLVLLGAAYGRAQLSVIYPLARGLAPVLVLIAGIAIAGTAGSPIAATGVVLVGVGVVAVRGPHGDAGAADVVLALSIAACIAGYTTIDKAGVTHAAPVTYYELTMTAPSLLSVAWLGRRRGIAAVQAELGPPTMLAGLGMFGAYALVLTALTMAPAAAVSATRETSVVIAVILAGLFLAEPVGPRRLLGAVVVVAGIAALAVS